MLTEAANALQSASAADARAANARFVSTKNRLIDDSAFIARCNVGSEKLSDADVERIRQMAQTPWLRHFDDTLGLGPEESARRCLHGVSGLPTNQQLLQDKPRASWCQPQ